MHVKEEGEKEREKLKLAHRRVSPSGGQQKRGSASVECSVVGGLLISVLAFWVV